MPQKTNAARFLDQMGISYELREYEVDPDDLAAEAVATKIDQIFFFRIPDHTGSWPEPVNTSAFLGSNPADELPAASF